MSIDFGQIFLNNLPIGHSDGISQAVTGGEESALSVQRNCHLAVDQTSSRDLLSR